MSDAQGEASAAQTDVDNAQKAVDDAQADLDDAKEDADAKKADADGKVKAFEDKLKELEFAGLRIYQQGHKVGTVSEAQGRQTQAGTNLTNAQADKAEKSDALDAAKEAMTGPQTEYDEALEVEAEKQAALEAAENRRDEIEDAIAADIAEKRADMESKETALNDAKNALTNATGDVTSAEATLTQADNKLTEVNRQLADAQTVYNDAADARDDSQDTVNTLQDEYDDLVEAITPLREAQAAEREASEAKDTAATELGNAEADELQAEADLEAAIQAYEDAKDLKGRADLLSYEDALETPITDEDFTYLNDYINAIADADAAVVAAQKTAEEKKATLKEAQKVYDDAKAAHLVTLANLAAAQADYDRFAQEEADRLAAENAKATAVTLDATATKAARTGDNAPIIGYVAAGTLALAAVAVARPKVRYRKQK